jgi:hypothetical protein
VGGKWPGEWVEGGGEGGGEEEGGVKEDYEMTRNEERGRAG